MTLEQAVQDFVRDRLGNGEAPRDLKLLLRQFSERSDFAKSEDNPLMLVGADLLWPGQAYSLLDHDYLSDLDRADSDIMANISAMQDTDKKLRFVLQSDDGSLLGYWQPDGAVALSACSLFWLDTEGQYEIAEGRTLSETLAYRAVVDGDAGASSAVIRAFGALGVEVAPIGEDEIFERMDRVPSSVSNAPQAYRHERYEQYRRLAGLS